MSRFVNCSPGLSRRGLALALEAPVLVDSSKCARLAAHSLVGSQNR